MMTLIPPRSFPFLRRSRAVSKRSPSSRKTAGATRSRAIEAGFSRSSGCESRGPRAGSTRNGGLASAPCSSSFRWVDTWAYLISVPFLILMILGIAAENRPFIHTGAVVVVLANYGRFWADLLAFFVRPYKDGPLQGLAFLFPPYTFYYLATRWDSMKKIVRRIATSCIPIVLVVLIYGFLPSANPEVKDVQGFGAKLEAGKHELDKEIESDLKDLEKKLIKLEKPK